VSVHAVPEPDDPGQLALFEGLVIARSGLKLDAPRQTACIVADDVVLPQVGDVIVTRQYHIVTHVTIGARHKGAYATEPYARVAHGVTLSVPGTEVLEVIPAEEVRKQANP